MSRVANPFGARGSLMVTAYDQASQTKSPSEPVKRPLAPHHALAPPSVRGGASASASSFSRRWSTRRDRNL